MMLPDGGCRVFDFLYSCTTYTHGFWFYSFHDFQNSLLVSGIVLLDDGMQTTWSRRL